MNLTKENVAKFALGVALLVPSALAGKFIGAGVGCVVGGILAFGTGVEIVDWAQAKLTQKNTPRLLS